jgi:hypothetical protein
MDDPKDDPDYMKIPEDGSIPKFLDAKLHPERHKRPVVVHEVRPPTPEQIKIDADRAEERSINQEADRRWRNFVTPGKFRDRIVKRKPSIRQFAADVRKERGMTTEVTTPKKRVRKAKAAKPPKELKKEYIIPLKSADEARRKGTKAHERFHAMRKMAVANGGKVLRSSALEKCDYRSNDLAWDLRNKNVKVSTA